MTNTTERKPISLSLVRSCSEAIKPVFIEFEDLRPANFEIPDLIKAGEEVLYVKARDFIGVVPRSEFAVQKIKPSRKAIGRSKGSFVHSEYELQNPDGSKQTLVVFSTREYEAQFKNKVYDEIESSEFIRAKVVSFTEYGTILIYKGVMVEMNDGSFSDKTVPSRSVLSIGEEVDVRFRKFRNRKQKVIVDPVIPFPKMSYNEPLDKTTIKKGQIFNGEIKKIDSTSVQVVIGRDVTGGRNVGIKAVCRHPHPAISQYLSMDVPVRVKILSDNNGKSNFFRGSIEDINRDFVDDHIFEYRQKLEEHNASKEDA